MKKLKEIVEISKNVIVSEENLKDLQDIAYELNKKLDEYYHIKAKSFIKEKLKPLKENKDYALTEEYRDDYEWIELHYSDNEKIIKQVESDYCKSTNGIDLILHKVNNNELNWYIN